jgi:hypothetical protein
MFLLIEMETKSTIGLSWAPKLPPMLTDAEKSSEKGKDKVDSFAFASFCYVMQIILYTGLTCLLRL